MPREMFPVASMLVSAYHVVPAAGHPAVVAASLVGLAPRPRRRSSPACSASLIVVILGTALALLFSAANVFFRDFSNIVATLTSFVTLRRADDLPLRHGRRAVRAALPTSTSPTRSPRRCCSSSGPSGSARPPDPSPHRRRRACRRTCSRCGLRSRSRLGLVVAGPRPDGRSARLENKIPERSDDRVDRGRERHQDVHDALPPHHQADDGRDGAPAAAQRHLPRRQRRLVHRRAGRVDRPDGPQRLGQEHAAQADQRRDAARRRPGADPRPDRRPDRDRGGLPPPADRPGERLPQRRDPRA